MMQKIDLRLKWQGGFELALINEMGTTKVWMRCENETYDVMIEMEDYVNIV